MKFQFVDDQFDPMVDDPYNYRFGIFYYNARDKRVVVPKRNRILGFTLNFARPHAYLLTFGIAALLVFAGIMSFVK